MRIADAYLDTPGLAHAGEGVPRVIVPAYSELPATLQQNNCTHAMPEAINMSN